MDGPTRISSNIQPQAQLTGLDYRSILASRDYKIMKRFLTDMYGISEASAHVLLRKLLGISTTSTLSDIKNVLHQLVQNRPVLEQSLEGLGLAEELLHKKEVSLPNVHEEGLTAKPSSQEDQFVRDTSSQNLLRARLAVQNLPQEPTPTPVSASVIFSKLVSSPRDFASWLVNNKSAYIALRSQPEVTMLLMAIANQQIRLSPLMLAELAKLLANLIKLKQGSSATESADEKAVQDRAQDYMAESSDKEHSAVQSLMGTVSTVALKPLADFLIEAERFAEEEVANMWSLTLKKEREIGQRIIDKFKNIMEKKHE
jgi:hypothetical protein